MKKLINLLLLIVVVLLISCSKEVSINNNVLRSSQQAGYLWIDDVILDMDNIEAVEVEIPVEYNYALPQEEWNWKEMKLFKKGDQFYAVYIWEHFSNEKFMLAQDEECHHVWYSNGDCKDTGTECEVTIVDGEIIIICCEILNELTLESVLETLDYIGAIEIDIPENYEYIYDQEEFKWDEIRYFHEEQSDTYYSVYIWSSENLNFFKPAAQTCHHKWYPKENQYGGDCKDKSNECQVTREGGEIVITLCLPA